MRLACLSALPPGQKSRQRMFSKRFAAVTGNETVRVVRSGSGFTTYGEGRSGSVMRSTGGFVIYYGGETHRVAKSASGWTIYKDR